MADCAVAERVAPLVVDRVAADRVVLVLAGCFVAGRTSGAACVITLSDALCVRAAGAACVVDVVRR